jgi:outer membrane protein assembly factor BamD
MILRKLILLLLILGIVSCGPKKVTIDPKTKTDAEIYQMGQDFTKKKDYDKAREAYRTVFESFPQSDYRIPAKLGIADSYFSESREANWLLAYQEYQDFISLFPFSPKACYAQLRMGQSYFRMSEKPDRDQSNTKKATEEFRKVVDNYPNCEQYKEAYDNLLKAYLRLAEHEYGIGFYYHRTHRNGAAVDRIKGLLKTYPESVYQPKYYFTLAQSLEKLEQFSESCTYYNTLIEKWPQSEYASKAKEGRTRVCK